MKNSKTKKKSGVGKTIAVLALSAIMLAGGCAVGYGAGTRWTYKRGIVQTAVPDGGSEISNEQTPMQLKADKNDGAKFNVRALKAAEYQEYEIDAQSVESAYTATVTLANHNEATDKSISLTAEFADGQSASEYISFSSVTVQSGEQFTITCNKAFGQVITIKATANGVLEGAKPSCSITANYVCRYNKVTVSWGACEDDEYFADHICFDKTGSQTDTYFYRCSDFDTALQVESTLTDMSEGTMVEGIKDFRIVCNSSGTWEDGQTYNSGSSVGEPTKDNLLLFKSWQDELILEEGANVHNGIKSCVGDTYSEMLSNYNAGRTVTLIIRFTGKITGINYEFFAKLKVQPTDFLYVNAQNPSFSTGDIIF